MTEKTKWQQFKIVITLLVSPIQMQQTQLSTPSALNNILCYNIHVSPNIACSKVDDFFILPLRG